MKTLLLPSKNKIIQGYSSKHKAYDFSGIGDEKVTAVESGVVVLSINQHQTNWQVNTPNDPYYKQGVTRDLRTEDYGNLIKIKHDDGTYSLYAHLTKNSLTEAGTHVSRGEKIAIIGNTGNSTGRHLHFEYRNSSNINEAVSFENDQNSGGSEMDNYYKGYNLNDESSMKVAVDKLVQVVNGEYVEKSKYDEANKLASDYEVTNARLEERLKQERKANEASLEAQKNELLQQCDTRVNEAKSNLLKLKQSEIDALQLQVSKLTTMSDNKLDDVFRRFTSRKFIAALLALLIPILNKYLNLQLNAADILATILPLMAFIGFEGWTDYQERLK